jgi:hypothetical protein
LPRWTLTTIEFMKELRKKKRRMSLHEMTRTTEILRILKLRLRTWNLRGGTTCKALRPSATTQLLIILALTATGR